MNEIAAPKPRSAKLAPLQKAIADKAFDEAIRLAEAGLAATPEDADLWNALGVALRASGQPKVALGCYRRALDLRPNDLGVVSNWANALKDLGRYREAAAMHQRVVAKQSTSASWTNLGVALHDGGVLVEALAAFDRAVALDPANHGARFDRAQVLLRMGDYARGWADFEARWKLPDRAQMPDYTTPVWDGAKLPNAGLLVWPEQGFGDNILSARFLPLVKTRVGRVVLGCKPELARLFEGLAGADEIVPVGKAAPPHAAHAPIMSIPRFFMRTFADLPPPARLRVPAEAKRKLAPALARAGRRLKVGIVWSGSVTFKGNAQRAVGLERFLTFAELEGVQLFSLQKGPRAEELERSPARNYIIDLAPLLDDFADAAAAVEGLDLVVMTDSSVAHLAGSLGRPVWNLLPFMAYWLYLDGRSDSPWYPSMRLFRQRTPGDWDGVFAEARTALAELALRHRAARAAVAGKR